VALGGVLLLVAWEGTHRKLWAAITGQPQTNPSPSSTPFNPLTTNIPGSSACVPGTPGCPYTNASTDYKSVANQAALTAGINPVYFSRQIQAESGFNPNAQSPAGAQGIAQFMPATAKGMGVNPFDPIASLKAAAQLMGAYIQKYGGGIQGEEKALAAYNWGSGNLASDLSAHGSSWLMYTPPETQNYINTIVGSSANPRNVS
jgi:hypothetical protein